MADDDSIQPSAKRVKIDNAPESAAQPKNVIHIDPRGDLTLVMSDSSKTAFTVCSKTMMRRSSWFESVLSQDSMAGSCSKTLPWNDVSAVAALLHVVHANFGMVPGALSYESLVSIVQYAKQSNMMDSLSLWAETWCDDAAREGDRQENAVPPQTTDEVAKFLERKISYIFLYRDLGLRDRMQDAIHSVIYKLELSETGQFTCRDKAGVLWDKTFDKAGDQQCFDMMKAIRLKVVRNHIAYLDTILQGLMKPSRPHGLTVGAAVECSGCRQMWLGCIFSTMAQSQSRPETSLRGKFSRSIWPLPHSWFAEEYLGSVDSFRASMMTIQTALKKCTCTKSLASKNPVPPNASTSNAAAVVTPCIPPPMLHGRVDELMRNDVRFLVHQLIPKEQAVEPRR